MDSDFLPSENYSVVVSLSHIQGLNVTMALRLGVTKMFVRATETFVRRSSLNESYSTYLPPFIMPGNVTHRSCWATRKLTLPLMYEASDPERHPRQGTHQFSFSIHKALCYFGFPVLLFELEKLPTK